ncbi:class F sortase [Amycolatopsis saalfeldensis]|uniref:Sortase (Surface protein transpeptidase) n=1 Tax=Amycolatopsis saalfeldensis TaxID=394193 RepID=A0A1H8Y1G6_9PSEU|nr:class F sortase [Amycolatopsis saalfeldensis]SEP45398.1 Sortase (surface protein transpeptidase) [Amycolatopsis saalfeldensis]
MQGTQEQAVTGSRRWARLAIGAAVVAALATGCGQADQVAAAGPTPSSQQQPAGQGGQQPQADPGTTPGTVRLPAGGSAKLVAEDVGADGALVIPQSLDEAAWWGSGLGADKGVTLFSGHVNWKGKTGPFDQLWQVKAGQTVTVTDTAGAQWGYRVDDVRTIHKSGLAAESEKLFSPDGPHRLVLVTCGGDYVGGTEGYDDNRVATAELVTRP